MLWGCNIGEGFADFGTDVFEPEPVFVDGPGHRIAKGRFSGMLLDPWGEEGAVIVAFRHEDDGPHLRMQPFAGGKSCDVGRAQRCIVFNKLDDRPQLVAYLESVDAQGRGILNFTHHDCETAFGGIENAQIPSELFESPPGYLVDVGNQLLEIDPWDQKIRVLAEDLWRWSGVPTEERPLWVIDKGELVMLDSEREPLWRVGSAVTETVQLPTLDSPEMMLVDAGNLVKYASHADEPITVAEGVCQVALRGGFVTYVSPCGTRRMVAQDLQTGTTEVVEEQMGRVLQMQRSATPAPGLLGIDVLYTKPSVDSPGFDDVWVGHTGQAPTLVAHRLGQFLSGTPSTPPTLLAVVDSDGVVGRLVRIGAAGEVTLAEGVAVGYAIQQSPALIAMINSDGIKGDLVRIDEGKTTSMTVLARGLPMETVPDVPSTEYLDGSITDPEYLKLTATVYDVEGRIGTLGLAPGPGLPFEPLATGVPQGRFGFFRRMSAIGYLSDWDLEFGGGTLALYQTHLQATSVVAKGVAEFTELLWPYEGVLYTVPSGDNEGIWVARAK